MFTFVIISYNQEEYIIEHLESIKYQIEHYGKNIDINLILSDDGSTDRTVIFGEIWINQNRSLFQQVEILVNEENQGIVDNYLKATGRVKTSSYILLDGDDLYNKHNIFETMPLLSENEIIFTPTIAFNEVEAGIYWDVNNLLALKTKGQIKKYLKHSHPFNTPGTFYSTALVQEQSLRDFISKYTWISDLTSLYYLFNKRNYVNYGIYYKPYTFYRNTVGISRNKENTKNLDFEREDERVKSDFGMLRANKGINIDYFKIAVDYKVNAFKANFLPANRKIKKALNVEAAEAKKHLSRVQKNAKLFYETSGLYDALEHNYI